MRINHNAARMTGQIEPILQQLLGSLGKTCRLRLSDGKAQLAASKEYLAQQVFHSQQMADGAVISCWGLADRSRISWKLAAKTLELASSDNEAVMRPRICESPDDNEKATSGPLNISTITLGMNLSALDDSRSASSYLLSSDFFEEASRYFFTDITCIEPTPASSPCLSKTWS